MDFYDHISEEWELSLAGKVHISFVLLVILTMGQRVIWVNTFDPVSTLIHIYAKDAGVVYVDV